MYKIKLTESYFPSQPDATIKDSTVGDLLREIAEAHPTNVALVDISENGDVIKSFSYSELLTEAMALSHSLSTRFHKGEKVVVWAPNIPQWIFMEYACALSGIVLVTANPSFQTKELKYVIEQSGAVGVFLVSEYRGNKMEMIAKDAIKGNPKIRELTDLEDRKTLYCEGEIKDTLSAVQPDDPAQIQYTSGTTGFPKGAVLSHKSLLNNAKIYCDRKMLLNQ